MQIPSFVKEHWLITAIFGISAVATVWFGVNLLMGMMYFNDPRHQDEALKPWMTPRYVVMSYDLPRDVVADVLNMSDPGQGRRKMGDIADDMNITLDELTSRVRDAATAYRDTQK